MSSNFAPFESVDNMPLDKRYTQYGYNGRIFFPPEETYKPYDLYKGSSGKQSINTTIVDHIIEPTDLTRAFFSMENVEYIQSEVVRKVFEVSNHKIGKQSYSELHIIMKSIYLQYGKNLRTNIKEQVATLDNYVITECVNIIVPNVLQYIGYIRDISSPIPVMPLAQATTLKGTKTYDFSSLIPTPNP